MDSSKFHMFRNCIKKNFSKSSYSVKFTEVYIRRDGHWLLTAWQTKRVT